ncbi:hypothetical protein QBC45DRAFT_417892 [Copromyces sp. CBS 386.78]|nr:hypothetical protein QBC45DRAFT_417892 [Copromyces sp. CBS 386.78]
MGLTTRYLGRITGSGLLSTISVCVVGWTGCVGCVHVYTNDGHLRAAMGKRERKTEKGVFAVQYSCFFWNHMPRPLSLLPISFLSLFLCHCPRASVSFSLSLSLSRVSLCVYLSVINL